jgi:hypothetical protein
MCERCGQLDTIADYDMLGQKSSQMACTEPRCSNTEVGCAYSQLLFIRFEANLSEYGIWILFTSYSHVSVYSQTPFIRIIRFHVCMFRYFRKHHFFASFVSYSLQNSLRVASNRIRYLGAPYTEGLQYNTGKNCSFCR